MKIWKMKKIKITVVSLVILSLVGLTISLTVGGSKQGEALAQEDQTYAVQRGNLAIDITAAGNLALSRSEDLAFDLFYPEGTVEEVLVEEGDPVKEGQVLAKVDASEWDEQLSSLEDKVTTAERQVTAKQRALTQAEISLIEAEDALEATEAEHIWPEEVFAAREKVWAAENDVAEAKAMLNGGQITETYDRETGQMVVQITEAKTAHDIEVWTNNLADAEEKYRAALVQLDELLVQSYTEEKIAIAEENLTVAQVKLDGLIVKSATDEEIATQRRIVELAREQLEDAKDWLEGVVKKRLQLEQAEGNMEDARLAIEDTEKAFENARKNLDEAKSKTPLITAPFDGFVTKVNVKGGDEIKTGTIAVVVADPNKFEAEILVGEADILQLKEGVEAKVQVDVSGLTLLATVTHISPTATIQSGVVNYSVKVKVASLEEMLQEQETAQQETVEKLRQGELPENLRPAVKEGRMTQEEAEERIQRMQAGTQNQTAQASTAIQEDFQLRDGLSVTVTIVVKEANDVLLVPNAAIVSQRGQTYVRVVSLEGTIEQRTITAGINDSRYTEVIKGLSEGEQIIIPEGTTTTPTMSTTSQQRPPGGMMPIPGMGRP